MGQRNLRRIALVGLAMAIAVLGVLFVSRAFTRSTSQSIPLADSSQPSPSPTASQAGMIPGTAIPYPPESFNFGSEDLGNSLSGPHRAHMYVGAEEADSSTLDAQAEALLDHYFEVMQSDGWVLDPTSTDLHLVDFGPEAPGNAKAGVQEWHRGKEAAAVIDVSTWTPGPGGGHRLRLIVFQESATPATEPPPAGN